MIVTIRSWAFKQSEIVKNIYFGFLFAIIVNFTAAAHAEGMCQASEEAVFNCVLGRTTASLCEMKGTGVLTYRNGTMKKIDLEVSDMGPRNGAVFYFSNVFYAGGGEAHIRFSRARYTYYLYDKSIKTGDGPEFSAGIIVYRGSKKLLGNICGNDASIRQAAYSSITNEPYENIESQ
ncbi:hypothetical protein BJG93_30255 (plasmid) [Paraburkholderia sprentiae WSM5005]|uniref:Uncharacterized protein n=1 Tax=Paraburkholderia sprentiae WSM5005 TaxID=754502 RepID=A0A1I9YU71_9BURK|nr:hypothetical protein [Paraburkholderia sprentiae]APA89754.2 hypothetical protein BJG93_30255 [Paraburkholderia sprentiae WSM5005]